MYLDTTTGPVAKRPSTGSRATPQTANPSGKSTIDVQAALLQLLNAGPLNADVAYRRIGVSRANLYRHLARLRDAHLVTSRRIGRQILLCITPRGTELITAGKENGRMVRGPGLKFVRAKVLLFLADGPRSMAELQTTCSLPPLSIGQVVRRLVYEGLALRSAGEHHIIVQLTRTGLEAAAVARADQYPVEPAQRPAAATPLAPAAAAASAAPVVTVTAGGRPSAPDGVIEAFDSLRRRLSPLQDVPTKLMALENLQPLVPEPISMLLAAIACDLRAIAGTEPSPPPISA